ncbi:MAG TPA: transporter substrate-binding domain-containing protein [Nocardioidaceae bacterium]|nr:transporter substrate-binding domain-containing protein [Nocardioidaceae bacterium]
MKRFTSKLLLIPMLAVGLAAAGCTSSAGTGGGGGGGTTDQSAGSTTPATSQLTKVEKSGTLRVAVLPDFPPSAVQKPNGEFAGYEIDIAKDLAEQMGVKLQLVPTNGDSRLPLLQSNRVDVNISSWTATNERALSVGFTIPYVAHGAGVIYDKNNPISSLADLAGKKVSVARGSTNDTIMTTQYPKTDVVRFDTIADALAALKAGKVDAAVESYETVNDLAKQDPSQLAVLDVPPISPSIVSMGVLPGDQVWINYLNNYIRNLITSGTDNKLYEKWFHRPLPSVIG